MGTKALMLMLLSAVTAPRSTLFRQRGDFFGKNSDPYFDAISGMTRSINYHAPNGVGEGMVFRSGPHEAKNRALAARELKEKWSTWYGTPWLNHSTIMSQGHPEFNPRQTLHH